MTFKIGTRNIGNNEKPYCIAEVGINHNGSLEQALKMIQVAKEAGSDAIKFQTFKASEFCGENQEFTYMSQGKVVVESMLKMFQRHEFNKGQWSEIKKECDRQSITFLSTPQNYSDLKLLLDLNMPAIKIGSDDLTNTPLIQSYAKEGLPLILSSGMSDLAEIYNSINIAGGFDGHQVALLLCTSQYPTPPKEVNLSRFHTFQNSFPGVTIGFSDHTQGSLASSLAVVLGATILEKHFTLDHNLPGPDHWFSEDPNGLKEWINSIHKAHKMKGNPIVRPTELEAKNKNDYQRRLVAACNIKKGDIFTKKNIELKRVSGGLGFPPIYMEHLLTKPSFKFFKQGEPIEF